MVRLILFIAAVAAAATGLAWLADRPGSLVVNWEGYEIETSVFRAVVMLAALVGATLFVWSLIRQIWHSPAAVGQLMAKRRQQRGLEALSSGMIAIGAGDRGSATRYAIQARKALPNEPLTHLLRAQAAQLSGDGATSRRIFEAMLGSPDTEQLGLRGLYLEAQREGEREAARQFAERAIRLNPKLGWAIDALFDLQCRDQDWAGALETVATARKHGHIEKPAADRRRAVLLAAQAMQKEDSDPEKALSLALEAHGLAPDLVPAAAMAGRMLASRGNTPRATKIIQKSWQRAPHPDLATAYAYARLGDSPRDRLDRVKQLSMLNPMSVESAVAVATAAVEAKAFDVARSALEPFLDGRLTQRICLLMARVEGEQHGDKGRVREWLARAVNAPRDPAWTADGYVSDQWQPVSPVTGAFDAFQWRVPVESAEPSDAELVQKKLEELVPLGATLDPAIEAKPVAATVVEPVVEEAQAKEQPVAEVIPAAAEVPSRGPAMAEAAKDAAERVERVTPADAAKPTVADALVVEPVVERQPTKPEPARSEPVRVEAARTEPARGVPTAPAAPERVVAAEPVVASAAASLAAPAKTAPPAKLAEPRTEARPVAAVAPIAAARAEPVPSAAEANARASAAYARLADKPKGVAAAPLAQTAAGGKTSRDAKGETKIFVPPRAPDDPGPEGPGVEELRPTGRGYRVSS